MNGLGHGHGHRPSVDDYAMPPKSGIDPSGRVVVESYQTDIVRGFEKEAPLYNPVRTPLRIPWAPARSSQAVEPRREKI